MMDSLLLSRRGGSTETVCGEVGGCFPGVRKLSEKYILEQYELNCHVTWHLKHFARSLPKDIKQ